MSHKFATLGLALGKRRIAVHWLSSRSPKVPAWLRDVTEWSLAKERRLKDIRTDKKAAEDIAWWGVGIINSLSRHPMKEVNTDSSGSTSL